MTSYAGIVTAVPTVDTSPKEFAPTTQGGLQWSRWGMFIESKGKQGEKCDMQQACVLLDYLRQWETSTDDATRRKAWDQILETNADQVFSIGTVNGILQPVVVGPKVRNVPKEGYWAWDPGGYIGLKLFPRSTQRDVFRSRAIAGQVMVGVWSGIDNGVPTADMEPSELAPTSEAQLQWPLWGVYFVNRGAKGESPDIPEAKELLTLLEEWRRTVDSAPRAEIWKKMLALYTDQVFSIGTVTSTLQPVVRRKTLKNVPDKALFAYAPTAYLGVYLPDTFFFAEGAN